MSKANERQLGRKTRLFRSCALVVKRGHLEDRSCANATGGWHTVSGSQRALQLLFGSVQSVHGTPAFARVFCSRDSQCAVRDLEGGGGQALNAI